MCGAPHKMLATQQCVPGSHRQCIPLKKKRGGIQLLIQCAYGRVAAQLCSSVHMVE